MIKKCTEVYTSEQHFLLSIIELIFDSALVESYFKLFWYLALSLSLSLCLFVCLTGNLKFLLTGELIVDSKLNNVKKLAILSNGWFDRPGVNVINKF